MSEPSENEMLRSALKAAVEVIQDYLSYEHDGDPWKEDARAMGEMDINAYGQGGRLEYAVALLSTTPTEGVTPKEPAIEMLLLIKRSIAFADWAAGEGICPAGYNDPEATNRNPDEFLFAYSQATGDEEWATLADRITITFTSPQPPAPVLDEVVKLREEWQPIETAPKDGTEFIGWNGRRPFRCKNTKHYVKWPHEEGGPTFRDVWSGDFYDRVMPENPTHWMPLPAPPALSSREGGAE